MWFLRLEDAVRSGSELGFQRLMEVGRIFSSRFRLLIVASMSLPDEKAFVVGIQVRASQLSTPLLLGPSSENFQCGQLDTASHSFLEQKDIPRCHRLVVSSRTSTIGRIGQKGASRDPLLELCKPRENDGPARADGPPRNGACLPLEVVRVVVWRFLRPTPTRKRCRLAFPEAEGPREDWRTSCPSPSQRSTSPPDSPSRRHPWLLHNCVCPAAPPSFFSGVLRARSTPHSRRRGGAAGMASRAPPRQRTRPSTDTHPGDPPPQDDVVLPLVLILPTLGPRVKQGGPVRVASGSSSRRRPPRRCARSARRLCTARPERSRNGEHGDVADGGRTKGRSNSTGRGSPGGGNVHTSPKSHLLRGLGSGGRSRSGRAVLSVNVVLSDHVDTALSVHIDTECPHRHSNDHVVTPSGQLGVHVDTHYIVPSVHVDTQRAPRSVYSTLGEEWLVKTRMNTLPRY